MWIRIRMRIRNTGSCFYCINKQMSPLVVINLVFKKSVKNTLVLSEMYYDMNKGWRHMPLFWYIQCYFIVIHTYSYK